MTRSRRRRTDHIRNKLMAITALAVLALATWYGIEEFFTPNVVARVLFSETANCTRQERNLVAGVMKNRIGDPAFGSATILKAVAEQPGAFSCLGDSDNANWRRSRHPAQMAPAERAVWDQCAMQPSCHGFHQRGEGVRPSRVLR